MTDLRGVAGRLRHPVSLAHERRRSDDLQLRLADAITAFAGSMPFVYLHIVAFAGWMLVAERSPWPQLTLAVSLEAIFLSTFVMIGQNRQGAFQQAKADHDFREQELELKVNTDLTRQVHALALQLTHHQRCRPADRVGTRRASGAPGMTCVGPRADHA